MPDFISGKPFTIKTLIENLMENAGIIKLKHDGGITGALVYIREYQVYVKGKRTNIVIKFIYNKRDDWADISISQYNLTNLKFVEMTEGIFNDRIQVSETVSNKELRAGNAQAGSGSSSKGQDGLPGDLQTDKRQV